MARKDIERFNGAVTYISRNVDRGLATAIGQKVSTQLAKIKAGQTISLKGGGFWYSGSTNQHWAVRALLLCQHAFLKAPDISPFVSASVDLSRTLSHYHGKSEQTVKEAILCYVKKPSASREDLARIAESEMLTGAPIPYETSSRSDKGMGTPTPVCFHAVRQWLYKAGFVSLRWMATTGYSLGPNNCNEVLGLGEEVDPSEIASIPRGYFFNFHAANDRSTNHWGISLGRGWAAGSNTTPFEIVRDENGSREIKTEFRPGGGSTYGIFTLASSFRVCSYKYQGLNRGVGLEGPVSRGWEEAVIRQNDPERIRTYF